LAGVPALRETRSRAPADRTVGLMVDDSTRSLFPSVVQAAAAREQEEMERAIKSRGAVMRKADDDDDMQKADDDDGDEEGAAPGAPKKSKRRSTALGDSQGTTIPDISTNITVSRPLTIDHLAEGAPAMKHSLNSAVVGVPGRPKTFDYDVPRPAARGTVFVPKLPGKRKLLQSHKP
jgi:hypothetical protein